MATSGELDLSRLLATLEPKLQDGEYVFATLADKAAAAACAVDAIGTFAEAEGITLIVPAGYSGLPAHLQLLPELLLLSGAQRCCERVS